MAKREKPCVVCGTLETAMCFAGDETCSVMCQKKRAERLAEAAESEHEAGQIATEDLRVGGVLGTMRGPYGKGRGW